MIRSRLRSLRYVVLITLNTILKVCTLLSILLGILFSNLSMGQEVEHSYRATILSNENGSINNYVTRVVSDNLNIKWIGNQGGMVKYNGKTFSDYLPGKDFPDLLNENIETLFIDPSNTLWIGTKSGGISSLNVVNNTIQNYNHLLKPVKSAQLRVMAIAQDQKGHIWIGTWSNGVYVISIKKKPTLLKHIPTTSAVLDILCDAKGYIWFGDYSLLHQYDTEINNINTIDIGRGITDLLEDSSRNRLWIATIGKEYPNAQKGGSEVYNYLDYYQYNTHEIQKLKIEGVHSDYARYLALDKENNLFIGTWGFGLFIGNKDLTEFKKINLFDNPTTAQNIIYQTILDIHVDKNNFIWLSMAYGGVIKLVKRNGFFCASQEISPKKIPNDFNISVINVNQEGVWIGTSESGLLHGKDFSSLQLIKETADEKVYGLYQHDTLLFVGLESGVKVFDLDTKKVVMQAPIKKATSFLMDEKQYLWIGTQQNGILRTSIKDFDYIDTYVHFNLGNKGILANRISQIIYDPYRNQKWVATYNGIYLFDEKKRVFIRHDQFLDKPLPSVIINHLFVDKDFIWVATPRGLLRLAQRGDIYQLEKRYHKKLGFKSDFICAITDDEHDNIWFSTISEIVKFNKSQESFISYGRANGIETSMFNRRSFFKSAEGVLYFGGIDNLTFFKPDEIKDYDTSPELHLTTIKVNSKPLQPGMILNNQKIASNIEYLEKISLSDTDGSLQIGFVLNDYLDDLGVRYRYRLKGLQENWIELNTSENLNFAGLPAGNYVLEMEGTRNNSSWTKTKELEISVKPPTWLTWWAFLLYAVAGVLFFGFIFRMKTRELRLKRNLELTTIEKEKEAQLIAAKLSFFTNISHEFRTPLTLILGPLEELISKADQDLEKLTKLEIMQKNAQRLLELINQLLDFRKADNGKLDLKVADGNFVRFAKEVFLYFKEMAKNKNITYSFITSTDSVRLLFDRGKMEIVLSNLLSNAFKNTPHGGEITLKLVEEPHRLKVSVIDSGKGVSEEEVKKIFDRYYQIKDSRSAKMVGSGIGLSFSKAIVTLHKGSIKVLNKKVKGAEFVFTIPLKANFEPSHIVNKKMNTDLIENYEKFLSVESAKESIKGNSGETILVIDDNEDIKAYLKNIFEDDYNILSASDGVDGCKIALEKVPDIIISDVMMPRKDGLELCKELKNNVITSHIPIILLTARTASIYEIEGLLNGADAYVTKPFNPNVIKARLKSILDTRIKLRKYYKNKVKFGPSKTIVALEENADEVLLNDLIAYVENHLDDSSFGIEQLMKKLCVSQTTLYRKLKSLTGLSPTAFIRSIRLKKAAELILTTDYKLSYIAFEVGFNDYKYFKSSFKKQFDCLPSKYKERLAEN